MCPYRNTNCVGQYVILHSDDTAIVGEGCGMMEVVTIVPEGEEPQLLRQWISKFDVCRTDFDSLAGW